MLPASQTVFSRPGCRGVTPGSPGGLSWGGESCRHTHTQKRTHKDTERLAHHTWTSADSTHSHTFNQIKADTHPYSDTPQHTYIQRPRERHAQLTWVFAVQHTHIYGDKATQGNTIARTHMYRHTQANEPKDTYCQTETLPEGHSTELCPKDNWQERHPSHPPLIPLPPLLIHGTLLKACSAHSLALGPQRETPEL